MRKARQCIYTSNGIPKYDRYVSYLEPYESCRRNKEDKLILEVTCAYCGKWFIPTIRQVGNRIDGYTRGHDSCRLYCSEGCKQECPIFRQKRYFKGQQGEYSREIQPELRQMVFARDDYTCQKCGGTEPLHCHHIEPVKWNPIESADIDVCITLCRNCHVWIHTYTKGCGYHDLAVC